MDETERWTCTRTLSSRKRHLIIYCTVIANPALIGPRNDSEKTASEALTQNPSDSSALRASTYGCHTHAHNIPQKVSHLDSMHKT